MSKKAHYTRLKRFTIHETVPLNYLMIILQFHQKLIQNNPCKISTLKKMLQRLPIVLVQVKADNTSDNLLNEIKQIFIGYIKEKKLLKKYIII